MLQRKVETGYDIVAWNRLAGHALGDLFPIGTECDLKKAGLTAEFTIKNLLEPFTAFTFGKDEIVVFDRAGRERCLIPSVADDVRGKRSIRVETHIGLAEDLIRRHAALNGGKFTREEVGHDVQRQHTTVFVVVQNHGIREAHVPIDQSRRHGHLLTGERENFGIRPIQRRWKTDREIVADATLSERLTVAIRDLTSRRWDKEREGARLVLGFPSRLGIFNHAGIVDHRLAGHEDRRKKKNGSEPRKFHK